MSLVLEVIASIIVGIFINYFVTSELIVMFFGGGSQSSYQFITYLALILQMVSIFIGLHFLRTKQFNQIAYRLLFGAYLALLFLLLFGRPVMEQAMNLNILQIVSFEKSVFVQNVLNFVLFIPFGFVIADSIAPKATTKQLMLFSLCFVFAIEFVQLISLRGVFDIVDLFLNILGIFLGVKLVTQKNRLFKQLKL